MLSDLTRTRQIAELDYLQRCITELGLESELIESSAEVPLPTLIVATKKDHQQRDRIITLSYIPVDEDDLEHINLLQIYGALPFSLNSTYQPELEAVLMMLNTQTAIGSFGLYNTEISLRYVYAIDRHKLPAQAAFGEIIILLIYVQDMFGELIEQVNEGHLTVAEFKAKCT